METLNTALVYVRSGKEFLSEVVSKPKGVAIVCEKDTITIHLGINSLWAKQKNVRLWDYLCFDYTDDPTCSHAGHHGSLGYFRFRVQIRNFRVVQHNPLVISTKYFAGVQWEINRPLQRPVKMFAGEYYKPLKPEFRLGDSKKWVVNLCPDWWMFEYTDHIKKEYLVQNIDPYSAYNNSKVWVDK